jgi:hypothetical protein
VKGGGAWLTVRFNIDDDERDLKRRRLNGGCEREQPCRFNAKSSASSNMQVCDGAPAPMETTDANRESGRNLLNGPRLADDCGHSPQTEIDLMFRCA